MIIYSTTYSDTASSLKENIDGCLPDLLQPFLFHLMMKRLDYSMWFDNMDCVHFCVLPKLTTIFLKDTDCDGIDLEYGSSFYKTAIRVGYDVLTKKLLEAI